MREKFFHCLNFELSEIVWSVRSKQLMCTRSQNVKHYNSCRFQTAMHRKIAENIPLISALRLHNKKN